MQVVIVYIFKRNTRIGLFAEISSECTCTLSFKVQGILREWKAKVLLFVQKRTRASFVVQTSSDSSLSVPLGHLDHLKIPTVLCHYLHG
jgi:hypothetical protein